MFQTTNQIYIYICNTWMIYMEHTVWCTNQSKNQGSSFQSGLLPAPPTVDIIYPQSAGTTLSKNMRLSRNVGVPLSRPFQEDVSQFFNHPASGCYPHLFFQKRHGTFTQRCELHQWAGHGDHQHEEGAPKDQPAELMNPSIHWFRWGKSFPIIQWIVTQLFAWSYCKWPYVIICVYSKCVLWT